MLGSLETQHNSFTEIPYFCFHHKLYYSPRGRSECWNSKPILDEKTEKTTPYLGWDSLLCSWKKFAGFTHAPQWCLSCSLSQIQACISESRWHLPLRLKLQRRGCACSVSNLGLGFLRTLYLAPSGKSSFDVFWFIPFWGWLVSVKGGFWGEKCCCIVIVEFNSFLSLFWCGKWFGFFCLLVCLLFFYVFDVKVGRGKMWWRVEACPCSEIVGAEMTCFLSGLCRFMSCWAKQSGLCFHLCWDTWLQGKAIAVQMGSWKANAVLARVFLFSCWLLLGWPLVQVFGLGSFLVKFNIPNFLGNPDVECCVGTAVGACCSYCHILQRSHLAVWWQTESAGMQSYSKGL